MNLNGHHVMTGADIKICLFFILSTETRTWLTSPEYDYFYRGSSTAFVTATEQYPVLMQVPAVNGRPPFLGTLGFFGSSWSVRALTTHLSSYRGIGEKDKKRNRLRRTRRTGEKTKASDRGSVAGSIHALWP